MAIDTPCYCGHMEDEHEEGGPCDVDECKCVLYDADEDHDA